MKFNREDALQSFNSALQFAERQPPFDGGFWVPSSRLSLVTTYETANGIHATVRFKTSDVVFSYEGVELLKKVTSWLHDSKEIASLHTLSDVFNEVITAAAYAVGKDAEKTRKSFFQLRDRLKVERHTLTLIPLDGIQLGNEEILDFGTVIIGMVGESLEEYLAKKCREKGTSYRFRFTDDVTWTENFLAWKNDASLREEMDISSLPMVAAVWCKEQGHKATSICFEIINLFYSVVTYFAKMDGQVNFRLPRVLTTLEYLARYQDEEIDPLNPDHFVDEHEFLRFQETTPMIEPLQMSKLDLHLVNVDDLFEDQKIRQLVVRLLRSQTNEDKEWVKRLSRHIQWCFIADNTETLSNRYIALSIALEALLGKARSDDNILKTLCERAWLLESKNHTARNARKNEMKKYYETRSRLVHGSDYSMWDEKTFKEVTDYDQFVRMYGSKLLELFQIHDWTSSEEMNRWFDQEKEKFSYPLRKVRINRKLRN